MFLNTLFPKNGTYPWVFFLFLFFAPFDPVAQTLSSIFFQFVEILQSCALE